MIKKILIGSVVVIVVLLTLVVVFVGPWPTYSASDINSASYYKKAIAAIDADAKNSSLTETPGRLLAGWAKAKLTPPVGVPLAGFGDRQGAPSTGVHDDLWVKALAVSDGQDTAVIVGSDMLIVPENVADEVRKNVAAQASLSADKIFLNSSHTHSGPGAFGPGFLSKQFAGEYRPDVVTLLADAFTSAIVEASKSLKPASLASGKVQVEDFIRNRTREAPTDSTLNFMVVQQENGDRCYVARYSAHATVLGGGNMQFCGDYPGFLQRAIEGETNGFAMFLSGAVGSMGPKAPNGQDGFAKAHAMGEALAKRLLEAAKDLPFEDKLDVASVGVPLDLPPFQLRLSPSWRVSPLLLWMVGLDTDGWFQGVRIGKVVLCGMPADFSGEISNDLRAWATEKGCDLWVTSFNGDYAGYISPDRYYLTANKQKEGYEMYMMSWCGPNQEALFTSLCKHTVEDLIPSPNGVPPQR